MISFFDNTCARNRRGKSCLPLLIQYLCWKNEHGKRSFPTFSLILVLDKQKRHSRQLSLDRDQSSVSPRVRPHSPNPSTHLTPTYSFWFPFFRSFQFCSQSFRFYSFYKSQPTQSFQILYYPAFVSERIISLGLYILQLTSRPTHWIWFLYGFVSSWIPKAR